MLEYWQRVKEILDNKGEKWVWLADQIGMIQQTLSKMVNFDRYPDAAESGRICKALNVTNEYLLTGVDPLKPDLSHIVETLENITKEIKDL
jgi:transcriptional regulator with XRE-family HTH domain